MTKKIILYSFGIIACLSFWAVFAYAAGFLLNLTVLKSIDAGSGLSIGSSLILNLILLTVFGFQHSGMARQRFKKWWIRFIPEPMERSVYVMTANLTFMFVLLCWQPMPGVIWGIANIYGKLIFYFAFLIGCLILTHSLFFIGHLDFIGLRQIHLFLKNEIYSPPEFTTPALYKYIRHPMMLGTVIIFWATPAMTVGHILFSAGMTLYILTGLIFEERDLIGLYGETYKDYKENVGMFKPSKNP